MNSAETPVYRLTVDEVVAALGTNADRGLSELEARARLERHGRNELAAERSPSAWRKFLAQFEDPLVALLRAATLISAGLWLYERDSALPYEAIAILAVVLLNALMGYVQQSRAEQAVAALRRMSAALFTAFNARSDEQSAFAGLFSNKWLWGAVVLSLLLQAAVIYVPFLQQAFSTVSLSAADWLHCAVVASSVLWLRELSKIVARARRGR